MNNSPHPTQNSHSFYCSTLFRYNYYEIYKEFYIRREPKASNLYKSLNIAILSTLNGTLNVVIPYYIAKKGFAYTIHP